MAKKFRWVDGARVKISAQVAGERLDAIRQRHGTLTPKLVLADAAHKTSPLHKAFLWDDDRAAEAFRLQQASYLLRSIEIVVVMQKKKPAQPVRAFVNVKKDDGKRGYAPIQDVMRNPELRAQFLQQAWAELQDWRSRYDKLSEFSKVFAAIKQVRLPAAITKKAA